MIWMPRRWVEFVTLAVALFALFMGLNLPPPIGHEFTLTGGIHHAVHGPGWVSFFVGSRSLSTNSYEPGYERISGALKDGTVVNGTGWMDMPWLSDTGVILAVSVDGRPLVSRSARLGFHWFITLVYLGFGVLGVWVAVSILRSPLSVWEVYRALEMKKRSAAADARRSRRE